MSSIWQWWQSALPDLILSRRFKMDIEFEWIPGALHGSAEVYWSRFHEELTVASITLETEYGPHTITPYCGQSERELFGALSNYILKNYEDELADLVPPRGTHREEMERACA